MKLSDILQEDRATRAMMGVVIGADDALERVGLLDTRRQGRGRWGSSHFPEPDAALSYKADRDQRHSGYQMSAATTRRPAIP